MEKKKKQISGIIKQYRGYIVYTMADNGQKLYVSHIHKGEYIFNFDYTHARHFSHEAALKHVQNINYVVHLKYWGEV